MAWQTPKTDWEAGDFVTYVDLNRICGNLNYLLGSNTLSESWTAADYVHLTDWHDIVDALEDVQDLLGAEHDLPDDNASSYNFNLIESFCLDAKDPIDELRRQQLANHYVGEGWRVGSEIFVGGFE